MSNRKAVLLWAVTASAGVWFLSQNSEDGEELQTPSPLDSLLTPPQTSTVESGMQLSSQESAFLSMISQSEGTAGSNGYYILYGGQAWGGSLNSHPAQQGWPGVQLSAVQCAGAGFGPGCVSTAAGRYQINRPTWVKLASQLGLPDFSPSSQDAAALGLCRQHGALDMLNAGDVTDAIAAVSKVWASLPGANYAGQNSNALATVLGWFQSFGGLVNGLS